MSRPGVRTMPRDHAYGAIDAASPSTKVDNTEMKWAVAGWIFFHDTSVPYVPKVYWPREVPKIPHTDLQLMREQNTFLAAMLTEANRRLCIPNDTGFDSPGDSNPKSMVASGGRPMMLVRTEVFARKDLELSDLRIANAALQAQLSQALFEHHEHAGHLRRLLFEHHEHAGHLR
eukprot:9771204-Heterocapsa_arctica.AAC.1